MRNLTTPILLLSVFIFALSSGINAVSFPFVLYQKNIPYSLIGVIEAIEILAGALIAKFLYGWSKQIGVLKIIIIFAGTEALIIAVLPLFSSLILWGFLVFISGICWFSIIALRQSWINIAIDNKHRSMILGLNSTMICAGFAIGPLMVKIIGAGQYQVFIVSSALVISSGLILLLIKNQQPKLNQKKADYWQIIKKNHKTFLGKFILDLQSAVVTLFTVIYGLKNDLTAENAGILVSVFMLVGLFDFIIGGLIKNKNLPKYINIGFLGSLISISLLPFVIHNLYLSIFIFVIYGWFISLIFISIITKVNQHQDKDNLVAINTALQGCGGLGAFFGMILVGIFMQTLGANGFVILIIIVNLLYFIYQGLTIPKSFFKNKFWH